MIRILNLRYACPDGWTLVNTTCYLKVQKGFDLDSASAYCQTQVPTSYLADTTDINYLRTIGWWDMWVKIYFLHMKKNYLIVITQFIFTNRLV